MKLTEGEIKPSISRLKRARGQLDAVIRMMEEGRDCEEIVTQLSAADKAVSRASYQVLVTMMKRCLASDDPDAPNVADMEKMFLSFA
ncbi:metal-sensitive transcriptional regulator [Corynebacterium sanguinis]|uniref:metal-sensitive transcriptional regulator n=1 Tax=Corynebacterium sanguinis TaxID=2594913 RepID=UPI0011870AB6|nr:metal-sensitive transcriptional regulator [Corynebacterium sanguinis]MCT1412506.1 metal-sensitive transcriptional regulator [Corynebacterium sanguinis]MCT1443875.1 metal-sensitive transcriptional regulator [Corynebacterium sanguinis]MCT1499734.1 metal-sensitive transcriptional regulator [Corynebacterium sanguinis]QDR77255.1 transcriptional regulator [Corynebacterium sanguinis]